MTVYEYLIKYYGDKDFLSKRIICNLHTYNEYYGDNNIQLRDLLVQDDDDYESRFVHIFHLIGWNI